MDFYKIVERSRKDEIEIYPDFRVNHVEDLLVRGKDFYAVWNEEKGMWSQDILDVSVLIDKDLWAYADRLRKERSYKGYLNVKTTESDSSGTWARFIQYLKRYPDTRIQLDEKLTFANTEVKKNDYVSKRLPYSLEDGDHSAWDSLVDQLYSPTEREKIEWAIGAVVSGDSKKIQKFCVFYGDPGTGKGTIIDIITKLFPGYYTTFSAKALGSSNNQFATEVFRSNPLVAIETDGDLSRIEDNTQLNSIVSHEEMVINEKGKPQYTSKTNCFLFLGTNRPVKITDAKSGIIRRLIDISPKNKKDSPIPPKEYDALMSQIEFQLGPIAKHCLDVYRELGKNYYKSYRPKEMIMKTDVFYNFVEASLDIFEEQSEGVSLKQAYTMYKEYCDDALVEFKLPRHKFREELKNYFRGFEEMTRIDGKQVRSWYSGFMSDKFDPPVLKKEEHSLPLVLDSEVSLLDDILADCPAQYAKEDGSPEKVWDDVDTVLRDIDTKKVHYVQTQYSDPSLIQIDFDIRNLKGEKDAYLNMEAASKWPKTYAEYSKGGAGIHLAYIYDGDVGKLNPVYGEGIEVKVFRGRAALRRRLSKCNTIPIAHLSEGALPLREEKMIDISVLKDELHLRNIIKKCLRKENHGATRPEIDLIYKVLDDAYKSGISYDVEDMEHDILVFAMNSTHQADYCKRRLKEMRFRSKDVEEAIEREAKSAGKPKDGDPIVFFDIEIYPPGIDEDGKENEGLFLICWKEIGEGKPVHHLVNPKPHEVELLLEMKLMGYNNRDYDNHILAGAIRGYNNARLYDLSQRIIVEGARDAKFPDAYGYSYGDVRDIITNKQSLKKHEIDLGISHIEMGIPWDKPAPKRLWDSIIEYCSNDVIATEKVFEKYKGDFVAREILADIAGGEINDTTNQLTTKFIFGNNRHPKLVYTNLATGEMS